MPEPHESKKLASGDLHNHNAFLFLSQLKKELGAWLKTVTGNNKYLKLNTLFYHLNQEESQYSYGEAYVELCQTLEEELDECYVEKGKKFSPALSALVRKLYDNDNDILKETGELLLPEVLAHRPGSPSHEENLRDFVSASSRHDKHSPYTAGGNLARFSAMIDSNFVAGGLPTLRKYEWSKPRQYSKETPLNIPTEFRMPTQARRKDDNAQVKKTMLAFMDTLKPSAAEDQEKITYVYFNFLAYDKRSGLSEKIFKEKQKERELSLALDTLEDKKHVAVITLPADDGLMNKNDFKCHEANISLKVAQQQMLKILIGNPCDEIKDFHMSDVVRKKLFFNHDVEEDKTLEILLDRSIRAAINVRNGNISPAQRQAIWFHLINYELPKYILDTLQPTGFNMSCKDAIDRGGVASAWYNLMRSFESDNTAMSRAEFETALHGACLYVKGRGLNAHINRIWNAANEYVNANIDTLENDPKKSWLILWRDMNCPSERIQDVLEKRMETAEKRVGNDSLPTNGITPPIKKLIAEIKKQKESKLSIEYQKTLLEMLGRSMGMYEYQHAPADNKPPMHKAEIDAYDNMLQKLDKFSTLKALGQIILGFIIYAVTLGNQTEMLLAGAEKFSQFGFYGNKKKEQEIKKTLQKNKPLTPG